MKFGARTRIAIGLLATGAAGTFAILSACSSDVPKNHVNPTGDTSGDGGCGVTAGEFPSATCDDSTDMCPATQVAGCTIDTTKCGDPTTCEPLASNASKTLLDFRFRRLTIATPPSLQNATIQSSIVTKGIDLNAKECGELGTGLFNWLLRINTSTMTLETGGAPPTMDPFGIGFCFFNSTVNGLSVTDETSPYTATANSDGTTTYSTTTPFATLNIPIFVTTDISSAIILPLSNVLMKDITVSKDQNCIGSFNETALQSDCNINPSACAKWKTAGNLGSYITLEAADKVAVVQLAESLCVLLSNGASKTPGVDGGIATCARDSSGKITFAGDYCSSTLMPGGCADSVWLAATFAASAVTINDGTGIAACTGGSTSDDAGIDAASSSDAAPADASDAGITATDASDSAAE